jgi:hypothetical protein
VQRIVLKAGLGMAAAEGGRDHAGDARRVRHDGVQVAPRFDRDARREQSITATTVRCEPVVVGQAASARTRRMCHCCA